MSEKLGPRVFGHDHGQPFLGREFSSEPDYSDEIAREIDDEIRRIVEAAHQDAKDIPTEHRESLESISEILVQRETIEKQEFEALLGGKSEEDVFGPDEPSGTPELPVPPPQPDLGRDTPPAPRPEAWPAARRRCAELTRPRSPTSPEPPFAVGACPGGAAARRRPASSATPSGGSRPPDRSPGEWRRRDNGTHPRRTDELARARAPVYRDPEHMARWIILPTPTSTSSSRRWTGPRPCAASAPTPRRARSPRSCAVVAPGRARRRGDLRTPFFLAPVPGHVAYLCRRGRMGLRNAALHGRRSEVEQHPGRDVALRGGCT